MWAGLVAVTLALIFLVATRWGKSRPILTCATLSLLAHVLLACLATIVRIVTASEQVAQGPPIRIRLVGEDLIGRIDVPPSADVVPTESLATGEDDPPVVSQPLETSPPLEPLARVDVDQDPVPDPVPIAEVSAVEHPSGDVSKISPVTPPADSKVDEPPVVPPAEAPPESHPDPSESLGTESAPTATPFDARHRPDRLGWLENEGGSRQTEFAVRRALEWLASAQSPDGRWDASLYGAGLEQSVLGQDRQGAGAGADTGVTALALLAFLGAGHTHRDGGYQQVVRDGLNYLLVTQTDDGDLSGPATFYARMYCHSMSVFALAEALAVTGDEQLVAGVRRGVGYSLRAQHPQLGGWRYRPGDAGDTSQLGWQLMALRSAELAGIDIPSPTWTGVERFLRSVARGQHGGLASYRPDGPASRSMTAEALYCRQLIAPPDRQMDEAAAAEAIEQILQELPGQGQTNLYYWYYATLALYQLRDNSEVTRRAWCDWNESLKNTLPATQVIQGTNAGSWEPNTVWGGYGGRVYSTALAAMCLEIYYRYSPVETSLTERITHRPSEDGEKLSR
jgi:hypothetical protein